MKIIMENDGNRFEKEAEMTIAFVREEDGITVGLVGDSSKKEVAEMLTQGVIDVVENVFDGDIEAGLILTLIAGAILDHVKEEL